MTCSISHACYSSKDSIALKASLEFVKYSTRGRVSSQVKQHSASPRSVFISSVLVLVLHFPWACLELSKAALGFTSFCINFLSLLCSF